MEQPAATMPDIDEILEILQHNVDSARERMNYLLEEEGLREVSGMRLIAG